MAIAVPDELQESVRPGSNRALRVLCGRSVAGQWQVCDLPANHRASECALERCLEGFGSLDGHKSVPSREPMCPGGPWKADCLVR